MADDEESAFSWALQEKQIPRSPRRPRNDNDGLMQIRHKLRRIFQPLCALKMCSHPCSPQACHPERSEMRLLRSRFPSGHGFQPCRN